MSSALALSLCLLLFPYLSFSQDVITCNGVVKSQYSVDYPLNYSRINIQLLTSSGAIKETSDCSPTNGYFLIPVYDKGEHVIRIVPPTGWIFSPSEVRLSVDGSTDECSRGEDIVFSFTGFSVTGQVIIIGKEKEGPSGVTVSLLSKPDTPIATNKSIDGGKFLLEGVPPGHYILKGSHPLWNINKNQVSIEVSSDSVVVPVGSIIVEGFDVKGNIESNGEPVRGVQFLLYSETLSGKSLCGESVTESGDCVAVSDASGVFTYHSLPPGNYKLESHYESANSTFQVYPESLSFTVENDSLVVMPKFEVQGFTILGRVLSHHKGNGLEGVKIDFGGQLQAVTDKDGRYQLLNVSAGSYTIKIEGNSLQFDPVSVEVSPTSPVLPDIVPSRYSVCGHVTITRHHHSLKFHTESRKVALVSDSEDIRQVASLDSKGNFCFMLSPGRYSIKVTVSENEAERGLSLVPGVLPITVETAPISGLEFNQYIVSLSGSVTCLVMCRRMNLLVEELRVGEAGKEEKEFIAKVTIHGSIGSFTVEGLLPGNYKISLEDSLQWCWEKEDITLSIPPTPQDDPPVVHFNQTGYLLTMDMSHDATVNIMEGKEVIMSMSVKKGFNYICMDREGQFVVVPVSCHTFEADMYMYLTSVPYPMEIKAVSHKVDVLVYCQTDDPLLLDITYSNGTSSLVASDKRVNETNGTIYYFSFYERPKEWVVVCPTSPNLIFYPKKYNYTIKNDCPESLPPFKCSHGFFVIGRIDPPLSGVSITVTTGDNEYNVTTDDEGRYKVGPLSESTKYTVVPYLEEYVFEPFDDDLHSFKAMKKSKLTIKINDHSTQNPLAGVLISVNGEGLRNSTSTSEEGSVAYSDILPGQYYIKPLLREFEFQPPSMVVDLKQGEDLSVDFKAFRVAFSCSGKVLSLNGSPLESISVELVSQVDNDGHCKDYHDAVLTDKEGHYKFRGLQPKCQYQLSLATNDESMIEKGLPVTRHITLSEKDIEGESFIAVLKNKQVFVTGNVIINNLDLLTYITVGLYSDKYLESQVFSVGTDPIGFFCMPPLPRNNSKTYFVQLDSSLLYSQSYKVFVSNSNVSLTAGRDTHITFNATAESVPLANGNNYRGSFVGIFVALIAIFVLANIDKILVYIRGSGTGGGFRGKRH